MRVYDLGRGACVPRERVRVRDGTVRRDPVSFGHKSAHLFAPPNGLRLSGARKGVRCSRGLGDRLISTVLTPDDGTVDDFRIWHVHIQLVDIERTTDVKPYLWSFG
jgi:hypothetical protein